MTATNTPFVHIQGLDSIAALANKASLETAWLPHLANVRRLTLAKMVLMEDALLRTATVSTWDQTRPNACAPSTMSLQARPNRRQQCPMLVELV